MGQDTLRVYLVDDDSIFAVITEVTLKKLYPNVELLHFLNGEEALAHIDGTENTIPSLLFLDINMPLMNGWEFLDELARGNVPAFPICMVSSSIDPEDRRKAESNPRIIDFIEKPFEKTKLIELIEQLETALAE
ncbi:response regulator receiver domain-containing protein [Alteromonadaceae bacterium 2753L.S.0a.02]|nr:response regulator receiver domain-containing protein [Alteromonadaceae bacterium 2753L.S.0a.02]